MKNKANNIEIVALFRDGGSMIIIFNNVEYWVDYRIGSTTRGQIFTNPKREKVSKKLHTAIMNALAHKKYGKKLS